MNTGIKDREFYSLFGRKIFDLQTSRDSYFIRFPNNTVNERDIFLNEQIERLLLDIKESADKEELTKADYCYLSGKLLNLNPNGYEARCEELLSKAVKLNPAHTDAWNELGECLWRKRDITGAKNCFESALQKGKNKVCLRNMSIILRQLAKNSNSEKDSINESFSYAKEALELDPSDPVSLYVLGNAYLTCFFYSAQTKPEYIAGALDCYDKAAKDEYARVQYNADLYFNQAVALRYEENYQSCLDSYRKAVALDPSFVSAKQQLLQMLSYLPQIHDNIVRKGKIKAKRLQQLTKSICRQTDLGPFVGGHYQSKSGLKCELIYSLIQDLKPGANGAKVCLGRVVASIFNENVIPLTFCIVDETGFCTAVTVYNFHEKFGVAIGQSIAIAEPYFANVEVNVDDKILKFPSIRVSTPELMVINGRKCGRNVYASTDIVVSKE